MRQASAQFGRISRIGKWAEACLWLGGCAALGFCAYIWTEARVAQSRGNRELEHSTQSQSTRSQPAPPPRVIIRDGDLVGRVEVPRLDLSVIVFEGSGTEVLDRGAGHLSGTA